ncbi:kelch-like protein 21 [Glossina fuscipes fuscipes]
MATKRTDEVKSIFRQKCENFDFATIAHKMRSNREHFGFSLDIDGGIIYVHKVMFENDLQEKMKEFHKLEDTNAAIKPLAEYVYTGIITLTKDNIEMLLSTADLLQFEWIKEKCGDFLKQNVNQTNCLRMLARKLADKTMMEFL